MRMPRLILHGVLARNRSNVNLRLAASLAARHLPPALIMTVPSHLLHVVLSIVTGLPIARTSRIRYPVR